MFFQGKKASTNHEDWINKTTPYDEKLAAKIAVTLYENNMVAGVTKGTKVRATQCLISVLTAQVSLVQKGTLKEVVLDERTFERYISGNLEEAKRLVRKMVSESLS